MNTVIQKVFKEFMVKDAFIDLEICKDVKYRFDLFFINILDQIFQQTVIQPNLVDIQACLTHELKYTALPQHLFEFLMRKEYVLKIFKLINHFENNRRDKVEVVQLVS